MNKELPNLTKEAYKVALDRSIDVVGEKLKKVYDDLYNEK